MAEWKERYLELWNNYSKRQRYMIVGAAALVFIAIVAGSIIYGGKPDMVPLFTNMEAKDEAKREQGGLRDTGRRTGNDDPRSCEKC